MLTKFLVAIGLIANCACALAQTAPTPIESLCSASKQTDCIDLSKLTIDQLDAMQSLCAPYRPGVVTAQSPSGVQRIYRPFSNPLVDPETRATCTAVDDEIKTPARAAQMRAASEAAEKAARDAYTKTDAARRSWLNGMSGVK